MSSIYRAAAVLSALMLLMVSCNQNKQLSVYQATNTDSILFELGRAQEYEKLLVYTDSFERMGGLTEIDANRWRGVACNHLGQQRQAEYYYRKVMDANIRSDHDKNIYFKSVRRLAEILVKRGEYEDGLRVAMDAVNKGEEWGDNSPKDRAIMLKAIGCCQLHLGHIKEAAHSYETAYHDYLQLLADNDTIRQLNDAIMGANDITLDYINTRHFAEALMWTERADTIMQQRIKVAPNYRTDLIDEYQGRITINRAIALQGLGRTREAAQAYSAAAASLFGKKEEGKILAADYLIAAGRHSEAANNYNGMDHYLKQHAIALTLDNIRNYMLPKLRANIGAGRHDSIASISSHLCDALDSAIVQAQTNDAAELATIYHTQEKEAQIAQQQADLSRQRLFGISIASLLVLIFLVIYIYHRIKAQRRLAHAYQKLEIANEKLEKANEQLEEANEQLEQKNELLTVANARAEESSRMKTNFIQQISHEIRTPLNILSGYTQIITTPNMELDDETRNDINRQITENTDRITGLVNKMLELSDAHSLSVIEHTDTVPAIQIAAEAAEASGIVNAKHLTFDMKLSPEAETAVLTTNQRAATRALSLILDNARKFTKRPEAMSASITSASPTTQQAILSMDVKNNFMQFIVEDTGIGVPLEEADRIFDEFVQLDEYYDGTGIGLTVARSLARRLGGDIVLDTAYSPGARFIMTLPMA